MRIPRTLTAAAGTLAATVGLALTMGAGVSSASAVPRVVHTDTTGIAGYYVNNSGGWRIRDARAKFTVTAEDMQLNGSGTATGADGVELCNPNNDRALQAGLVFTGGLFRLEWANGTVSGPTDPCVTGGLASIHNEFPGNVNSSNLTIHIGDVVQVEAYYSPTSHHVTLTATDFTQDAQSEMHVSPGAQNFREAGIGVLDIGVNSLVPPAILNVASFNGRFTNYGAAKGGTKITGGWDLHSVTGLNGLSNAVLVPSAISGGNAFSVAAGIS